MLNTRHAVHSGKFATNVAICSTHVTIEVYLVRLLYWYSVLVLTT